MEGNKTIVDKPWGYEIIWAKTDNYAAKLLHINKSHKLSLQFHKKKEETIYVTKGILHLVYGTELIVMKPGESQHIPANTIHRMIATDEEDVEVMEVSTPFLDDIVRIEDDYGRIHG